MKACASVTGLVLAAVCLLVACHQQVKEVSTDAGNGSRKGSPPLCFDYRGEVQATGQTGVSNVWAYLNNTCNYTVNCTIFDDVTEKEQSVGVVAYRQLRFLLASGVPASRVRLKLECSWNP